MDMRDNFSENLPVSDQGRVVRTAETKFRRESGVVVPAAIPNMKHAVLDTPTAENLRAADAAGLRYTSDHRPGISRHRKGDGFVYKDAKGRRVTDLATLGRIKSLVIPPAWTNVWICPTANGHLQATGRDLRQRKQYRYHSKWRRHRDDNKFSHVLGFARMLPKIRRRVGRDLASIGMPRNKVLAAVVKLLETTLIRIGNDEYARTNKSYGLTTMRNGHAKVKGGQITFKFRGKSGRVHDITLQDRRLAAVVRHCQEMPGQELFAYEDEEGGVVDVGSQEVNDYLREITGGEYTAKDFRTWAGTVLAAIALQEMEECTSETQVKNNILTAVESVAAMLGNTPAVCRKCYIHPGILDSYLSGATIATVSQRIRAGLDASLRQMRPEEAAVVVLLQRRLKNGPRTGRKR